MLADRQLAKENANERPWTVSNWPGSKAFVRTRSHRLKICVQRGLGGLPSTSAWGYLDSHRHRLPVTLQTFICNFTAQLHILALFEQKNYNVFYGGMNMDYMTLKEASEKWGVTPRRINYYCTADRIPGAVKMGTVWLIPKNSQKPADRRFKSIRSKDGENK